MRPYGQYVMLCDQTHYRSITIDNSRMGIHQETHRKISTAAVLNGKLREAIKQHAGYAASGNGYPPGTHRDAPESARLWFLDTPLGPVLAGHTGGSGTAGGLCLLTFPPEETLRETDSLSKYLARIGRRLDAPVACNGGLGGGDGPDGIGPENGAPVTDPPAEQLERELTEWFAGARRDFDIPLALRGTPFQQSVWEALRAIPYGAVQSYGELAQSLGKPDAVRAVGAANGRNPVSIIVPCHRVIGANGSLTGYAGGLERKRFLLALEQGQAPEAQGELFG